MIFFYLLLECHLYFLLINCWLPDGSRMWGWGFEGSIGVDRTDKRTLGDTMCTNVWYLGNCSQAGIVEATLCLCMGVICMSMHMSHTHKCILVCVHVRMRLKMRLERHTRVGL